MSDPTNKPTDGKGSRPDRRRWIKGENGTVGDAFDQRADAGREELANPTEAADLLDALDAEIDALYGSATDLPVTNDAVGPNTSTSGQVRKLYVPKKRWFALAAAVALFLIAGWWLTLGLIDASDLYATNFSHYENDLVVRQMGEGGVNDPELAAALKAYEARNYPLAETELTAYLSAGGKSSTRLYLGISQLANDQLDAARTNLTAATKNERQTNAANWYLALTELKANQPEAARPLLQQLANGNSLFKNRATALLNKL
jgi:hypothetical protein